MTKTQRVWIRQCLVQPARLQNWNRRLKDKWWELNQTII